MVDLEAFDCNGYGVRCNDWVGVPNECHRWLGKFAKIKNISFRNAGPTLFLRSCRNPISGAMTGMWVSATLVRYILKDELTFLALQGEIDAL